ncbi:hypothetical protein FQN54_005427 [Arachnomyces sp. PD_36]|nr:hypothetical protein FQN54_005427 [Arachnomyces sp. PD_36]
MIRPSSQRRPSSPVTSVAARLLAELYPVVEELKCVTEPQLTSLHQVLVAAEPLLRLRHTFIDDDNPKVAKDTFRQLRGYRVLLDLTGKLTELYDPVELPSEDRRSILTLLKDIHSVLAESLKDHSGNKKYFVKRAGGEAITTLEQTLRVLCEKLNGEDTSTRDTEQFYGGLFAAALGQEMLSDIFTTVRMRLGQQTEDTSPTEVQKIVGQTLGSPETVENPDFLGPLLRLWLFQSSDISKHSVQRLVVPATLFQLASQSRRNLLALHATGMLTPILAIMGDPQRSKEETSMYYELAEMLCAEGINNLDDAVDLYRKAHNSPEVSKFLLDAVKSSKSPPCIHFDLSRHGYSSVELSTLGRSFPPTATAGYTLAIWARFDQFDPNAHTTIFGAFDATQTCFVLAYLEKDTRNFILQTSIKGSRPSVRFKSAVFTPGRWYHICVIHKRPRTTTSSRASLFINGEFVEQLKAEYPCVPANRIPHKAPRIQAFLGTPQDLATKLGKGVSSSQWSLASAILFEDAYSDDLISVFYHLGPRYHGNFQDCLGSFQTYKASAALNLRNESLHPGKEEHSDIVTAIRQRASNLIAEHAIIINISPTAVLDDDDSNNVDESQLVKSLSRNAAKTLNRLIRSGGNAVVVNGAVPAINDALTQPHGVGILAGDPVVTVPQSLDDSSWRIGGCAAVHLSMVEAATTAETMLLAIEILFESVQDNWRNSEAMERENGYGILAALIREKIGFPSMFRNDAPRTSSICSDVRDRNALATKLLQLILGFVGYNLQHPNKSMITNPLAYRVLLVDLEIWRAGDVPLLDIYYSQFVTFAVESQHRRFNVKRLSRMRKSDEYPIENPFSLFTGVVKRFIDALKSESFTPNSLKLFMSAFEHLLVCCMSAELLRSLSLFITYAVHKDKPSALQKKKSTRFDRRRSTLSQPNEPPGTYISRSQIGTEVLRMFCDLLCTSGDTSTIKKFAKTVTNKVGFPHFPTHIYHHTAFRGSQLSQWLLYLMSEDEPQVVVLASKILARLLVIHGSSYTRKFSEKSGGFTIMRHRLKRWWHIPALWPICFAIMFGVDVGRLDLDRPFDHFGLLDLFTFRGEAKVVIPDVLPVITGMLQSGLKSVVAGKREDVGKPELLSANPQVPPQGDKPPPTPPELSTSTDNPTQHATILNTVIGFLSDVHAKSTKFRDFCVSSTYVQQLFFVLFPVVVGSDIVSADLELDSRNSGLTFDGTNVVIRPLANAPDVLHTTTVEHPDSQETGKTLRRNSSFILVSADKAKYSPSSARLQRVVVPKGNDVEPPPGNSIVQGLLELAISVFSDQLLTRKEFPGLSMLLKTPPGFIEHQTYFESWVLRNTLSQIKMAILLNQKLLWEPRVLNNLARFITHVGEAVFEGWFVKGAPAALDFAGSILEHLQQPHISSMKSIRLCSQAISTIRSTVFRTVLLELSEIDDSESLDFLQRLTYWQTILLSAEETQPEYLRLICYLLYGKLISENDDVRIAATMLWRIVLVQKPDETSTILSHAISSSHRQLSSEFQKLVEVDDGAFLTWVDDHRDELDSLFYGALSKSWESFVREENAKTEETTKSRVSKRKEKLKQWHQIDGVNDDIIQKHEVTFDHWSSNIFASEHLKHQRSLQDQSDNLTFVWSSFAHLSRILRSYNGVLVEKKERKWCLDQTEGRNRMRLRVVPDESNEQQDYQPKRKVAERPNIKPIPSIRSGEKTDATAAADIAPTKMIAEAPENDSQGTDSDDKSALDESFEMIDDPKDDTDYEDKNRKVMRSLRRGDQVKHVCNMSRIIGLEACEGLLILGKDNLYIIDDFFQRADGEIVNVWQAPPEERDPYVRMISGHESNDRKPGTGESETRSWRWADIISVSKRRFLFRDVALEIFFTDGRSYLLTLLSPLARNELYTQLLSRAPQINGSSSLTRPEDILRFEALRSPDDTPQSFGSKFVNVFSQSPSIPATRKWIKGEMSNFHYLMLINTLAGRTFNDLTQYPVFPWVLADYTSEELDLTNPSTFRDLSKPMGCQTTEREKEYQERYKSFAEMGDEPPFHYGTHYSSAMIVSSYLIRLQPFVKSYLLLQGGTFDHADRLFYSIPQTWESASRVTMTDVRELIPEFFYLPEFLENVNNYNFGIRQNKSQTIDSVELPPWAKGDPKIFIAKHREALESPYVTQNLHRWIDLVFGIKQKGEAALEAVNIFHHLSYQGARDLDNILDPVERLATIGIIHNFGQTPHQIFQRPHPGREEVRGKSNQLDSQAESLTRLPFTLLDTHERVSSLLFSNKQDRLLCAAAFRLNIPPNYDRYMEWGFADGSVRFYGAESRKLLGHFEHLHVGQLSSAIFADSQTLITSGTDCSISVWSFVSASKFVDLQPKTSLFGHRSPVTTLAVSRSFSTVLSASTDGRIMLWDLNRLEFVRELPEDGAVECARINDVTGNIMVCRRSRISLYTLNGDTLLDQAVCEKADDCILSCAFYEGASNEWLRRELLFTGHRRGLVNVWSVAIRDGHFELDLIRQLHHVDSTREDGSNVSAGISCILPLPQVVYTGDEAGSVYEWDCVQRH